MFLSLGGLTDWYIHTNTAMIFGSATLSFPFRPNCQCVPKWNMNCVFERFLGARINVSGRSTKLRNS